ncbi:hypothetical protein, partial [bacterium endosymbiont of Bathymodiolus sp. 5 South]|uniref:hypothetical protein n=1 Tax=bacterium endosymbiont of Bathymodiolus sp. 5 South TaxID=1181670 RepID=UPI00111A52A0
MNFLKLFLFLTSFLLASIPASAEAKNINFTSSEAKPYFFYTAKKPRIASNVNTTSNNKSSSIELNPALSNSKAAQKDKNDNTNKTPNGISNTSINYTNNKHNAKTKVLATLGSGNIQIADIDQNNSNSKSKSKSKSSTKLLNRDIKDTEVNIYNIASHKGLKGEIDTRLLTKNGRIQIAKDIKKSGMITSAIQQIVNTDRTELKDFFSEVD